MDITILWMFVFDFVFRINYRRLLKTLTIVLAIAIMLPNKRKPQMECNEKTMFS